MQKSTGPYNFNKLINFKEISNISSHLRQTCLVNNPRTELQCDAQLTLALIPKVDVTRLQWLSYIQIFADSRKEDRWPELLHKHKNIPEKEEELN